MNIDLQRYTMLKKTPKYIILQKGTAFSSRVKCELLLELHMHWTECFMTTLLQCLHFTCLLCEYVNAYFKTRKNHLMDTSCFDRIWISIHVLFFFFKSNFLKCTNQNEWQNTCYIFEIKMNLSESTKLCLEWTVSTTDRKCI